MNGHMQAKPWHISKPPAAFRREPRNSDQLSGKCIQCTASRLRDHIESLFKPGMSWDNYGFTGWHIDHKRPCASFDLTNPAQRRACFHYTNLQPLWWHENLKKGALHPLELPL